MWTWLRGLRVIEKPNKTLGGCQGAAGCGQCSTCTQCGHAHVCENNCPTHGGSSAGSKSKEDIIKEYEEEREKRRLQEIAQRLEFRRTIAVVAAVFSIIASLVTILGFEVVVQVRLQQAYDEGYEVGYDRAYKQVIRWRERYRECSRQLDRCMGDGDGAGGSGGGGSTDASPYYRDSPSGDIPKSAQDGLPYSCRPEVEGDCENRKQILECRSKSKAAFNRGEAEMALGQIAKARDYFSQAISLGRNCGSEFAVLAAKRLSALNLSCEYSADSLARISRGYEKIPREPATRVGSEGVYDEGDVIDLRMRQNALKALGHYRGKSDNTYGPGTREAIEKFQREFGFNETGDLTAIETVYLICAAAQNANDIKSMNVLGIMYMTGLGVIQDTDIGLRWLKSASTRGDGDATYNLAIVYGSGVVLSSYKICGLVENEEIADSYLWEAAEMDHKIALQLIHRYGRKSVAERWALIRKEQLEQINFYNQRLKEVGKGCEPS